MRELRALLLRVAGLFSQSARERELDEEFNSHLQLQIDDHLRSGMSPEEARRKALLASGGIEQAKESYRDRRSLPMIETLLQDLRYAARTLRESPGFTLIAIITLALGIGANTAIFTIVNAVLIEPLPYRDAGRVMVIWETSARIPDKSNVIAPANFIRWGERATVFEQLAAFYEIRANLTGDGAEPEQIVAQQVTSNFFMTLGTDPMLGRTFAKEEGTAGHSRFTVLGNGIWKRRFGSDPTIVGRTIQLNGLPFTVIGVMPPDVGLYLKAGSLVGKPAEIWLPFAFTPEMREPMGRYMSAIGRLKPGVSQAQAQAEMKAIAGSLRTELPKFDSDWSVRLTALHDELSGEVRPALLVLTGAVAFVLLIACANVANLLLARGAGRRREIAIRTALGAARWRIFRQLLTESLLLAFLGGIAGLLVARASLTVLLSISPIDISRMGHISLSYAVLAFTALVSFLTAAVCGFIPAFETVRVDVQEALKDGARQAGAGVRSRWLRQTFVVAEVAIAVVLLTGAGIMIRSFAKLSAVNPGFDYDNVLTFRVTLPRAKYNSDEKGLLYYRQAVELLQAIPGVKAAGKISFLPLSGTGAATGFSIVGQPPFEPSKEPVVDVRVVDNGYFQSMSIPLIQGRLFSEREMQQKSNVVIINETMAKLLGADPIGQRLVIAMADKPEPTEVIGIVADVKYANLTTEARAMAYWTHPQLIMTAMTFTVRTDLDPMAAVPLVTQTLRPLDKDLPLSDIRTMKQVVGTSLAQTRFSSTLLAAFGGLALLLAAIGIYGVMSYSVHLRSSEIALRLALGAERSAILQMVVRNGITLVAIGLAVGIPLALLLNRSMVTLLYDTTGGDPVIFSMVAGVLSGTAILASYLPARRASRTTPVEALRHQ